MQDSKLETAIHDIIRARHGLHVFRMGNRRDTMFNVPTQEYMSINAKYRTDPEKYPKELRVKVEAKAPLAKVRSSEVVFQDVAEAYSTTIKYLLDGGFTGRKPATWTDTGYNAVLSKEVRDGEDLLAAVDVLVDLRVD